MEINELIKNIYSEVNDAEHNISERLVAWLAFLEAGKETKSLTTNKNYIFATLDISSGVDLLLENELITENICLLREFEELADDFHGVIVMYDLVRNEGFPVITMKLPDGNVPKDIRSQLEEVLILMYESGMTTANPIEYEIV